MPDGGDLVGNRYNISGRGMLFGNIVDGDRSLDHTVLNNGEPALQASSRYVNVAIS